MSRLTGTDAYGLMEAYNAVYAPQELTEEQVWEEVENWVNSLVEEGYDLSDYTWEEMYESYLEEQGGQRGSGSNPSQMNQSANIPNPFPVISKFFKGSGGAGTTGGRQTNTRGGSQSRPQPTFQNTGGFGRYTPPSTQVKTPAPTRTPASDLKAGTRDLLNRTPAPTTRTPASDLKAGTRDLLNRTPAPTTRTPAAAPTTRPAAGTPASPKVTPTKPTATATPAPSTTPARPSLSSQADEIRQMRARSLQRQGKTLDAATVSGATRPAYQANSFDVFDVIKGHLLDEGYADTEEAALVIMANMSEEWKQSIITA